MKFQPKRFVVEVKRGTNRAAFASPDATADKFSGAEDLLFGRSPKVRPVQSEPRTDPAGKIGGRILKSLIEPPPPVADEPSVPARRGRKPGSKNKPKPFALPSAEAALAAAPRAQSVTLRPEVREVAPSWRDHLVPDHLQPDAAAASPPPSIELAASAPERPRRSRLRDRSQIIKRYVLETEPRPGQPGALRARKAKRRSRP